MDSSMPMILPKGILVNTASVYKEVASFPIVPADKLWEYWHVYTTTNKKLKDPTARRLENFWWQVWGSDRRNLSGMALAKIYEDISVGPTFVPLRGPPNRWEGPDVPPVTKQMILAHLGQGPPLGEVLVNSPPTSKNDDASFKSISSSASKPPPPHPILKKSRGPSTSGPRPTARFVSPRESGDEDDEADFTSSDSMDGSVLELAVAAATDYKKQTQPVPKKFTPASATTKPRPGLPRRTSPQSPLVSEMEPRENGSLATSRTSASQRSVSPIPEIPSSQVDSLDEESEDGHRMQQEQPKLSAKAAGKRPAVQARIAPELKQQSKMEPRGSIQPHSRLPSKSKNVSNTTTTQARRASDGPKYVGANSNSSNAIESVSHNGADNHAAPRMGRSQSHSGYERSTERGNGRLGTSFKNGLFTGATASTTTVAAQGTIIDQSGLGSLPPFSTLDSRHNEFRLSSRASASSLLDPQFTPSQPTTSASVPMGRTKSQLTLLLERGKANTGERYRSKS